MRNLIPVIAFAALCAAGLFALGASLDAPATAFAPGSPPSPGAAAPAPAGPFAPTLVPPATARALPPAAPHAIGPAPGAAFAPTPESTFALAAGNTFALAPRSTAGWAGVPNGVAPAPRAAVPPTTSPPPGWGSPPAPLVDPRRFTEAHWQGLEVVPNTRALARALSIDPSVRGVIVDDVTLPADLQGFAAGDVITNVNGLPTPDLMSFIRASDRARAASSASLGVIRNGRTGTLSLTALLGRMGTANGETPSMIPPNARMPHAYRGPCVGCHRIGTTGTLMVDQGDPMPDRTTVPVIRAGNRRPHVDRGPCGTCHAILP